MILLCGEGEGGLLLEGHKEKLPPGRQKPGTEVTPRGAATCMPKSLEGSFLQGRAWHGILLFSQLPWAEAVLLSPPSPDACTIGVCQESVCVRARV